MTDVIEFAERELLNYEDSYRRLHDTYVKRLGQSIDVIDNILSQKNIGTLSRETLNRAMHMAHGLAGSGTTFGFPRVTAAGQKVDIFLLKAFKNLGDAEILKDADYKIYEQLMIDLRNVCCESLKNEESSNCGRKAQPNKKVSGTLSKDFSVLIIDDDNHLSDLLSVRLRQKNIQAFYASDGEGALKIINHKTPDLIVLDIGLPGLSGHDILRRLKQDPEYVSIPILMLTAHAQEQDVVSALHSGAIDYIIKPVDMDQLVARVEKLLDVSLYTIVIADNDPLILQLLDRKFRHRGFKVKLAEDGEKAWNQIFKTLPDLVVLDRMMPGMEGLAVLKKMKSEDSTSNIPVIILSARNQDRDFEEAMKRGASHYMTKPFIIDDLIDKSLKLLKDADQ